MKYVDIISHPRVERASAVERVLALPGFSGTDIEATLRLATGDVLGKEGAAPNPVHLYGNSLPGTTDVVVLQEFPLLYANDFTLSWLGHLLRDTKGGTLWIELPDEKANARKGLLTRDVIAARLPGATIETPVAGWARITAGPSLETELAALKTIYTAFHNGFETFAQAMLASLGQDYEPTAADVANAERTYKYSLFGANQKSFVIGRIFAANGSSGPKRLIDIGGGFGFMGAELAAQGHRVHVTDIDRKKMEQVGPWLARHCGLSERLTFEVVEIESLAQSNREGDYDMVSYFGCLLYVDRAAMPGVLRSSMKMLKDSGLLIIHENVLEGGKPGSLDYEKRFPAEELRQLMLSNAGEPTCYSMFTGATVPWEKAAQNLVMAAIPKR